LGCAWAARLAFGCSKRGSSLALVGEFLFAEGGAAVAVFGHLLFKLEAALVLSAAFLAGKLED